MNALFRWFAAIRAKRSRLSSDWTPPNLLVTTLAPTAPSGAEGWGGTFNATAEGWGVSF